MPCTNSYSSRISQCIWNACMPIPIQSNHMQIYKHKYIHIKIKSHNTLCIYPFNIQISSFGLIYKHKQFDSNYLIKHKFSQKYIFGSLFLGTVKPYGLLFQHSNKSSVHILNPHFTATTGLKSNQYMIQTNTHHFHTNTVVEQLRAAPFGLKILY